MSKNKVKFGLNQMISLGLLVMLSAAFLVNHGMLTTFKISDPQRNTTPLWAMLGTFVMIFVVIVQGTTTLVKLLRNLSRPIECPRCKHLFHIGWVDCDEEADQPQIRTAQDDGTDAASTSIISNKNKENR